MKKIKFYLLIIAIALMSLPINTFAMGQYDFTCLESSLTSCAAECGANSYDSKNWVLYTQKDTLYIRNASDTSKSGCTISCLEKKCTAATYIGENVCQETNVINALRVVGYFILVAKILIPFLIIGFGIFDLAKAVTEGDSDKVSKGVKSIGFRVAIGIVVFCIPSLVNAILNGVSGFQDEEADFKMCQTCLLQPTECENGAPTNIYDATNVFEDNTRTFTVGTYTTASKTHDIWVTTEEKTE